MESPLSRDARGLSKALVGWFHSSKRDLPWRRNRTPWRTWVSEVMLQQTTVDTVAPRFEAFVTQFPDPHSLAAASDDAILAAWAGLGYYRRIRSLRDGARSCVEAFGGEVPRTQAALMKLPGVGPYTSGAIASLAFGEPVAAIDGNVGRVASRLLGIRVDPSTAKGRKSIESELIPLIPKDAAGAFNEALIELGALVCKPSFADCGRCPIRDWCVATDGDPMHYPLKRARKASVAVRCVRAFVPDGCHVWTTRIPDGQRLAGFQELPGRWLAPGESADTALQGVLGSLGFSEVSVGDTVANCHHVITHHRIEVSVHRVEARPPQVSGGSLARIERSLLSSASVTTETRKVARYLLKDRR